MHAAKGLIATRGFFRKKGGTDAPAPLPPKFIAINQIHCLTNYIKKCSACSVGVSK
jgi:hypothetical protein